MTDGLSPLSGRGQIALTKIRYNNRAESLRERGNYAAALAELEKAKTIDNFSEEIHRRSSRRDGLVTAERALGSKVDC
jgi:hypothetical protein